MFSEAFTATISCATSGAKIYYTTDGTTPTESSTEYSEGVSIPAETTTLKAIAYADGLDASEVATATYTYSSTTVEELDGLKALREAIKKDNITTASEAKTYKVKHAKLYVTRGNGTTNYMQDSECGVMCFGKDVVSVGASYDEGTATVTGYMYNGLVELTSFSTTGTAGEEEADPVTVTLSELSNNQDTYESRLVKVVSAKVTEALDSSTKDYQGEISQNGQTYIIYRQGSSTDIVAHLNATVDVVGIPTIFVSNSVSTPEIYVFRKADITEYGFFFSDTEANATIGQEFTAPTLTSDYKDTTVTYSSSDESVATVAEGGKVTLVGAGTTTITASITANDETLTASYTLTVKAASSTTGEVIYQLVTSTDAITADDYLIVCRSKSAVMGGKSDNGSYAKSVTVSSVISSTTEINASDLPSEVAVVTLSGSAGAWNLYTSDGYINASSTNSQKDIKYQTTAPNNATISISGNDAKIIWSTSKSGYHLRHNSDRFKTYGSSTGAAIQLFKKTYSTFYYSEKKVDVTIGKAFTAPTLNNEDGETVTYESSADSVATVNALGEVKIEGPGTVTITATSESGKKATYTINVTDDITSATEDDEYVFNESTYELTPTSTVSKTTYFTENTTSRANSQISADASGVTNKSGNYKSGWYVETAGSFPYAFRFYANNTVTIKALNDKKIKKIVFDVIEDKTKSTGMQPGEVTFANGIDVASESGSSTGTWVAADNTWETDATDVTSVTFKPTSKFFINNIKVYFVGGTSTEKSTLPITIRNKEGYATFYTNHPYKMPKGLQGSTVVVNSNAATTTATIKVEYEEQAEVPANTALLIKEVSPAGTTDSRTYNAELLSFTKAEKPSTNNLIGMLTYSKTVSPMDATLDSDYWFYNLSYSMQGTDIGWYWYNASGDEFDFDAYRCYLAIPKSSSSEAAPMSFVFGEDGDVTAISTATQNGQAPQAIYNLSGVRMNGTLQSLPKGIYIVNGKKVVK